MTRIINRAYLLLLFICVCISTQAQINLVKNASFENYDTCPSTYDQVRYAYYWNCIDTTVNSLNDTSLTSDCVPDYINTCSSSLITSTPVNATFYQYPRTGNGMMQVRMYCDETLPIQGSQVDYLQGHLYHSLIAGQSYCVTFYANLENNSGYAINHIGAYLDNGSIDTASQCALPQTRYTPQILDTPIITDTLGWTKIQGSFIATGTERFITLGNFSGAAHTNNIMLNAGEHYGVYLIDDVSVIASNATAYAGPDVTIARGDTAYIGVDSNGAGMPCYWYVLGGTAPIDSGGRIMVHPTDSTTYIVAMDLCGTVTYDTVNVRVTTLAVHSPIMSNVQIFPNPASTALTITAGDIINNISISNTIGQAVYSHSYNTGKVKIDISGLPSGVYFVKVNEVMVSRFVKE